MDAAGTAKLEASVPELGVTDTVTYTVEPDWREFHDRSTRHDDSAGRQLHAEVAATDRYANPIASAVPTFTATGVSVTSAGLVTATSIATRASIVVSYQGVSDSASVSVVPRLPMVINRNHAVVLINSDGTEKSLATLQDYSLSPSSVPTTPNVVYYQGDPGYSGKAWVVQPNGTPQPLMLSGVTRPEGWPRLSPDGTWVYFVRDYKSLCARTSMARGSTACELHDGTHLRRADHLAGRTLGGDRGWQQRDQDRRRRDEDTAHRVRHVRLSSLLARRRVLRVHDGHRCRDHAGRRNRRRVVTTFQYPGPDDLSAADWTPDGKWLLVTTQNQSAELIEVSTGAVLPLTGLGGGTWQASFVR